MEELLPFDFDNSGSLRLTFPSTCPKNSAAFQGGLLSDSHTPDEQHPLYPNFAAVARSSFERFAVSGSLQLVYATEMALGRISERLAC